MRLLLTPFRWLCSSMRRNKYCTRRLFSSSSAMTLESHYDTYTRSHHKNTKISQVPTSLGLDSQGQSTEHPYLHTFEHPRSLCSEKQEILAFFVSLYYFVAYSSEYFGKLKD